MIPEIKEVKDTSSDLFNERLTPRAIVEVYGYDIKIDGDDPTCGLWFVSENNVETKATIVAENKPSKIIALIPELSPGKWQLKVVTQYSGGGNLVKLPKVFVFPKKLTV